MNVHLRFLARGAALVAVTAFLGACATTDVNESINTVSSYYSEALAADRRGDYDQALQYYKEAASKAKTTRWKVANAMSASNRDEVDSSLTEIIAKCCFNQARICYVLKRYDKCIGHASDALHRWYRPRLEPREIAFMYALRGLSYSELGKWNEAMQDYQAGMQYNENENLLRALRLKLDEKSR
jgi:tetratricopeptide (TPR) repeat protein